MRYLSVLCALLVLPTITSCKLILWDLGDTLVSVSILGMVSEIGIADCLVYHLFHTKEKDQLQNLLFDVLEEYGGRQHGSKDQLCYHTAHRPLPRIMCEWLAGNVTDSEKLVRKIHKKIDSLYSNGYFQNEREYRIVKNAIAAMFNPQVLVRNTYVIKQALELVKEIARSTTHVQTIISNWDGISYSDLRESETGKTLSCYFDLNSIAISGSLNALKPRQTIFDICLEKYGLEASECILIDDQKENCDAAQRYGFLTIQVKNHDFKAVRKELVRLGVLPS